MENYMGMEIDMLNEKLKEKDERIKELEGIIVGHRKMVSNNRAYITRLDNEKRELAEEVDKQAEVLKEKDERIKELEHESRISISSKFINEVLDARKKIEELEKQIEERDARIEQLKSKNDGMALTSLDNISDLKVKIKERNEWIENLKEENETLKKKLEGKNKLIDYMRYKNDRFEEQVDKLNRDVSKKDETIKNLNKELTHKTMELVAARISSGTMTGMMYIDSNIRGRAVDEAFKAIDEAIKKLDEEN